MDTSKYLPEIAFPRKETFSTYHFYGAGDTLRKIPGTNPLALEAAMALYPAGAKKVITDEEAFKAARIEYATEEARLMHLFKLDCFTDAGLLKNPFTGALYDLAWERGHAAGLQEVYNIFMELAVLDRLARSTY